MDREIIKRQIVRGAEGLATFVAENIQCIRDGALVRFAAECPQVPEKDLDAYSANSTGWYGIEQCRSSATFDHDGDEVVLYMDYFVDFVIPTILVYFPIDSKRFVGELQEDLVLLAWQMGDRLEEDHLFYIECTAESKEKT